MRSRLDPIEKVARTLRRHRELILNWFRDKKEISAAAVEGMNANAKLALRKARGFRTYVVLETALYRDMGHLPKPDCAVVTVVDGPSGAGGMLQGTCGRLRRLHHTGEPHKCQSPLLVGDRSRTPMSWFRPPARPRRRKKWPPRCEQTARPVSENRPLGDRGLTCRGASSFIPIAWPKRRVAAQRCSGMATIGAQSPTAIRDGGAILVLDLRRRLEPGPELA